MSDSTSSQTTPMNILLLGSGGREHALAWKLAQSPNVGRLVATPGNPGIAACAELRPGNPESPDEMVALARDVDATLVVVGPEAPLAAGVSDALRAAGFAVFGPSQAASRLEWDKAFSKEFMIRNGIPTAASRTFSATEIESLREYLSGHSLPIVIKASGLAAGKGVVIATSRDEAIEAAEGMLRGETFGDAGTTVVVEEFMNGEEASIFAVTDGSDYVLLASSQDHKRVGDGDTGLNTGGMGAYAPAPVVTESVLTQVRERIIEPTLRGMREAGTPYAGCLFVGLMIENGAPRVVEFNSRFGDPETQVILPLYQGDLATLLNAAATGSIAAIEPASSSGSAVCIVLASEGYPGSYPKGRSIEGLDAAGAQEQILVFHAGTAERDGAVVTSGGRVLGVTAYSESDDLATTIRRAYDAVESITFEGMNYRKDIGRKGLAAVEMG